VQHMRGVEVLQPNQQLVAYPLHVRHGDGLWRGNQLAQVEVDEVEDDPQVGEGGLGPRSQHLADLDDVGVVEVAEDPQLAQDPLRLRRLAERVVDLLDCHLATAGGRVVVGVLRSPDLAVGAAAKVREQLVVCGCVRPCALEEADRVVLNVRGGSGAAAAAAARHCRSREAGGPS